VKQESRNDKTKERKKEENQRFLILHTIELILYLVFIITLL